VDGHGGRGYRSGVIFNRLLATTVTAAALALSSLASLGTTANASSPPVYQSVLGSGQHLTASRDLIDPHSTIESPSGVFALTVSGTSVEINEDEPLSDGTLTGAENWWQFATTGYKLHDRSTLTMQRDGDLVLRQSTGRTIWSSHTAGKGKDDYLQLKDDGDLVIRASNGRRIWHSATTSTVLTAAREIPSGSRLVNRYRQQFHITPTYLTMQRDGDLVLAWGRRRMWHSATHRRGAYAELSSGGRLEVVSTHGAVLWRSPSAGRAAWLNVEQCGILELSPSDGTAPVWNPTHKHATCG
jgi:hypothetical protein